MTQGTVNFMVRGWDGLAALDSWFDFLGVGMDPESVLSVIRATTASEKQA